MDEFGLSGLKINQSVSKIHITKKIKHNEKCIKNTHEFIWFDQYNLHPQRNIIFL